MRETLIMGLLFVVALLPACDNVDPASPQPKVGPTSNGGCLGNSEATFEEGEADPGLAGCDDERVELTVDGNSIDVVHHDATYNCCAEADEITIAMIIEGDVIHLAETATVANPCFCICCFDVETTMTDLPGGVYTVEFCWDDQESTQQQCVTQAVQIPAD
jgi:hypothetical protein